MANQTTQARNRHFPEELQSSNRLQLPLSALKSSGDKKQTHEPQEKVLYPPTHSPVRNRPRSAHEYMLTGTHLERAKELDPLRCSTPSSVPSLLVDSHSLPSSTSSQLGSSYRPRSYTVPSQLLSRNSTGTQPLSPVPFPIGAIDTFKFPVDSGTISKIPSPHTDYTLSEFSSYFSRQFPFKVKATKGFCSGSGEVSISQGEEFIFHFIKHNKVVKMKDSTGVVYSVPLNTAIQFGIVFDPYKNEKTALDGFQYCTVAEILTLKKLPTVISARKSFTGGNPENSVVEGEIFVVTGVRTSLRGRLLNVQSLTHGKKYLHEKCAAIFSTKPTDTSMTLTAMFQHNIPFPQKALLLPEASSGIAQTMPPHLRKSLVTLKYCTVETSIVASNSLLDASQSDVPAVDLPLHIDTDFRIVDMARSVHYELQHKTATLLQHFNPSKLCFYVDAPTTEAYQVQCTLYTSINYSDSMYGVQVVKPDFNFDERLPRPSDAISSNYDVTQDAVTKFEESIDGTTCTVQRSHSDIERRLQHLEERQNITEDKVDQMFSYISGFQLKIDSLDKAIKNASRLSQGIENIGVTDRLMSWCSSLQEEVYQLQQHVTSLKCENHSPHTSVPMSPPVYQD